MSKASSDLASFHAIVRGRVQGVFFRAFVQRYAATLGLTGYVRNLPSRTSIEVRAEGKREQLEELLQYLHKGPSGARVEKVETEWGDYRKDFSGFEVKY